MDWTISGGIFHLEWWGVLLYLFIATQMTIMGVTLYLHRTMAHRSVELHPIVSHILRFWLWMTTGMRTLEWVAIHRKHHAKVEQPDDPHSPLYHGGPMGIIIHGVPLYRKEAQNQETIAKHGHGCPNDWIERNLYTPHTFVGIGVLLATNILAFGIIGILTWSIQVLWIPFHAAGVINGFGHWVNPYLAARFGMFYQNWQDGEPEPKREGRIFNNAAQSSNIVPWGLWIGGEELHNNHHAFPYSPKFSCKPWEVDVGWGIIRVLRFFGLAKPREIPF